MIGKRRVHIWLRRDGIWKRVFPGFFRFGWLQRLSQSEKKIKSPFHWLQLLMFNSNSICRARSPEIGKEWVAMIRNSNFPYFWLPPPGRLLANGLQIVVVIWLTICFLSVSGPPSDFLLLFFCSDVVWNKRKTIFISTLSFVPLEEHRKWLFVF